MREGIFKALAFKIAGKQAGIFNPQDHPPAF